MSKLMLIDAAHAEETRVVVTDGNEVQEFDFESASRKQLRGNIYLAKVSRVEPSLQAAFIEYGGNRHGFLAFSEIHPDYYQIPLADREALMREAAVDDADDAPEARGEDGEAVDSDDEDEAEVARHRRRLMRRYKIQDVIKRRQIMLVQVVKEERGNKGAALTSYLSLAGRYGVLMPNTARGGGISRKIVAAADRKRLKTIVQGLDVPDGMGLIIRTAGAKRTKLDIQRDYEYLIRTWDGIRETTMNSIAPALIYAEEDLVKRAIRDMYDKEMDGIVVEGDKGFKDARDFLRTLMPTHVKKISQHRDPTPLFVKYKIEDHLAQIYSPNVPLRSGGYLVINQTEALVAIDVNSGRSTRERNIETTALKTNLEAAAEACRQLRLRDLAGLIVIDFIDMEESKNNRAVEKVLKDGLAMDRARVQMGKISMFGLMEISRQRRRTGVLEGTTHVCEHCGGTGRVRTAESSALSALRAVELDAVRNGPGLVTLRVSHAVGLYILNEKRSHLERLDRAHDLFVTVLVDEAVGSADHIIERTAHEGPPRPPREPYVETAVEDDDFEMPEDEEEDEEEEEEIEEGEDDEGVEADSEAGEDSPREDRGRGDGRGRGRSRRRRGRHGRDEPAEAGGAPDAPSAPAPPREDDGTEDDGQGGRRRRRRGRRGGRRMREETGPADAYGWARMRAPDGDPYVWLDPADVLRPGDAPPPQRDAEPRPAAPSSGASDDIWVELPPREERPARSRSRHGRGRGRDRDGRDNAPETVEDDAPAVEAVIEAAPEPEPEPAPQPAAAEPEPAPKPKGRSRAQKAVAAPEPVAEVEAEAAPEPAPEPEPVVKKAAPVAREPDPAEIVAPPISPKRGWWRR